MSQYRFGQLVWRWMVCSAVAAALFWGAWYLIAGSVPVSTSITVFTMLGGTVIAIPLKEISRWWDVFGAPVLAAMVIFGIVGIAETDPKTTRKDLVAGIRIGLLSLLSMFSIFWQIGGSGLIFGPIIGLFWGLLIGLTHGITPARNIVVGVGLIAGLCTDLGMGLNETGLVVGLFFGLATLITTMVAGWFGICIAAFIRFLCTVQTWKNIGRWLIAAQD